MTTKRYIVTSVIPNAKIDKECFKTLQKIAAVKKAEIMVIETAPNFTTDLKVEEYHLELEPIKEYLTTGGTKLSEKLMISTIPHNINVIDPLMGLETYMAKKGNIIIPFPRHCMKMVHRILKHHKAPRGAWCTATISEPYYKATKSGITAFEYHTKGGIFVEINADDTFQIRQLEWDGKGIYDLTSYYTPESTKTGIRAFAVCTPDSHVPFVNKSAKNTIQSVIRMVRPHNVVHNDVFDAVSISHHTEGKYLTKAKINLTLAEEGKLTSNFLQDFVKVSPKDTQHFLVGSNHHDHLDRYLDEGRYLKDKVNHILSLELALKKANGFNPLESLLRKFNNLDNVKVCNRDDSLKINGVELLCHGDSGSGGSRGTPKSVGVVYGGDVVTAHTHSPAITATGSYVVGTMTDLVMPYTPHDGGSNWAHSTVIVYPNGKRCNLVFV